MSDRWTEVNLIPNLSSSPIAIGIALLDSLIHESLNELWDAWFYSAYVDPGSDEPDMLRIRLLWHDGRHEKGCRELTDYLDSRKANGEIADWYEGSHGVRDLTYSGEVEKFGEMWELTYRSWMSGSELALKILIMNSQGSELTMSPENLWSTYVHMFSNPLGLGYANEALLSLSRAHGYLKDSRDEPTKQLVEAIENYFGLIRG